MEERPRERWELAIRAPAHEGAGGGARGSDDSTFAGREVRKGGFPRTEEGRGEGGRRGFKCTTEHF